jgi:hypothetical protein
MQYLEQTKDSSVQSHLAAESPATFKTLIQNQSGRIGYIIAWLLGVPASVLFVIFLIRGH